MHLNVAFKSSKNLAPNSMWTYWIFIW